LRAVVSRILSATCTVDGSVIAEAGPGLLILVAASKNATEAAAVRLADRIAGLRIFNDSTGKMNLGLDAIPADNGPRLMVVSNFTLWGDAWASRRPSFTRAAAFEEAEALYKVFVQALTRNFPDVVTGVFGEDMKIASVNDGPVTLVIDTR
jgi:D-aminoacyl-tRNA deacylase